MPALLAAIALQATAIDAERAFADMAQKRGQWAAFRAYAAPQALMFVPKPTNAQEFLKDQKDPPWNLMWWPARSWTSCDNSLAINTGPAYRGGGRNNGNFTTVWQRQADGGWKWLLDQGWPSPKRTAATDKPAIQAPVCRNLSRAAARPSALSTKLAPNGIVHVPGKASSSALASGVLIDGSVLGSGASKDGSFVWEARNLEGAAEGAHVLRAWQWDGASHRLVLVEYSGLEAR